MTEVRKLVVADGPPPVGPFSHAASAGGLLFVSGQVGFEPVTGRLVGDDFASQCRRTFANIALIAEAAGTDLSKTVRVGIFLRDMSDFEELNVIYREFFTAPYPARTTVPAALTVLVEADAVLAL